MNEKRSNVYTSYSLSSPIQGQPFSMFLHLTFKFKISRSFPTSGKIYKRKNNKRYHKGSFETLQGFHFTLFHPHI